MEDLEPWCYTEIQARRRVAVAIGCAVPRIVAWQGLFKAVLLSYRDC
jgi:hypothetical protein